MYDATLTLGICDDREIKSRSVLGSKRKLGRKVTKVCQDLDLDTKCRHAKYNRHWVNIDRDMDLDSLSRVRT